MTAELQYERLQRPEENTGSESFTNLRNLILPIGLRWQWPDSWSVSVQATWVRQNIRYLDVAGDLIDGRDSFGVVDVGVSYQLPRRAGWISLEARNLFDRRFRYQEIDVFSSPRVVPRRLVMLRLAASF
jgi:outer membrane receptor protein involved in Fe transport